MSSNHYVAGLLFSKDRTSVALVRKNRPQWQAGYLNAIGGKIEAGETAPQAMEREFEEETGVRIAAERWQHVAVLTGPDYQVEFFACRDTDALHSVRTMTDEPICTQYVNAVMIGGGAPGPLVPNLRVIIPLALDRTGIVKPVHLKVS